MKIPSEYERFSTGYGITLGLGPGMQIKAEGCASQDLHSTQIIFQFVSIFSWYREKRGAQCCMLFPIRFAMSLIVTTPPISTHAKHSSGRKKLIGNLCPSELIFPVSSSLPLDHLSSSDPFILIK